MAISLKVKGKIENGQLILDQNTAPFPWDGEVEVQVTLHEQKSSSFAEVDPNIKKSFEEAGIRTREQVLELIQDVKREMAQERFGEK
ncbi:hypothetical protein K4A83_22015 [Spirulina subsalsa FACHB-351]|uniref:Uncharacterized protein n=1 Tax=Spirulina subsalsa FACHB-351 TaxID=234711 RepID=A0ABT3LBN6_9CYAN|nr:hypothetical protein [Spirulina subsalsa]MCW6038910.1 hypothetical protein [Spirulina subsalsa FACHB-351]